MVNNRYATKFGDEGFTCWGRSGGYIVACMDRELDSKTTNARGGPSCRLTEPYRIEVVDRASCDLRVRRRR